MANKETSNFKQALNELLAGKITTDEPVAEPKAEEAKPVSSSIFKEESAEEIVNQIQSDIFTETAPAASSEETVISKSVVIEGNVRTTGKLTIMGEVTGNVISTSDLVITGKVGGSIQGSKIRLSQCEINDTVTATSEILVSPNSVINGDVKAGTIVSEGSINGNIDADSVTLANSSKTIGDIKCKTIRITEGASLKGKLETI
ncbi:MAG: polymer-forming cytoskeletal protein [Ruminococcaceae bacterium]|nr:polymer-forming cytoskeletal protein [Oscillospiraceae bacterium]